MCLSPTQDDDAVGFECHPVDMSSGAVCGNPDFLRVHRRPDGRSGRLLIDAEPPQDFCLAFRCRASMTSHCRDDERLAAAGFHGIRASAEELEETADPATSCRDRNPGPRFHFVPQPEIRELLS